MGLRALTSPNVLRAKHSILQIWQYLGPFVSSCGGGVAGLHLNNNLFVPLFEVTAGITAVVDIANRGKSLWRETLLVLATAIESLTQVRTTVRTIKGGWGGRATLRDVVVKPRINNPNRVDRTLSDDGLANVQQAAREEVRHPGVSKVSFGNGQRLRLLLERGAGFKIGTVVGQTESSGGKSHLISWVGGEGKVEIIDLETVLWIPDTGRGPSIHDSFATYLRGSELPNENAEIRYREEVLTQCRASNVPPGKYWLLNEWGLMNNVTIEVGRYFDRGSLSVTLSVEGKDIWEVDLKQVSETSSFTISNCRPVSPHPSLLDGPAKLQLTVQDVERGERDIRFPVVLTPKARTEFREVGRVSIFDTMEAGWYSGRQHGTLIADCEEGYVWRGDNEEATRVIGVGFLLQSRAWSIGAHFHYSDGSAPQCQRRARRGRIRAS